MLSMMGTFSQPVMIEATLYKHVDLAVWPRKESGGSNWSTIMVCHSQWHGPFGKDGIRRNLDRRNLIKEEIVQLVKYRICYWIKAKGKDGLSLEVWRSPPMDALQLGPIQEMEELI
ncbi:hypothetical protein SLA2020_120390 [Shorea laevis]